METDSELHLNRYPGELCTLLRVLGSVAIRLLSLDSEKDTGSAVPSFILLILIFSYNIKKNLYFGAVPTTMIVTISCTGMQQ